MNALYQSLSKALPLAKKEGEGAAPHPVIDHKGTVGMMTAEAPRFPSVEGGNKALESDLTKLGASFHPVQGHYGGPENSYIIHGLSQDQMVDLGKKYGQEAVIHGEGGVHKLIYTNGPNENHFHPHVGHEQWTAQQGPPEDFWTQLPDKSSFRLNFDFDQFLPVKDKKNSHPNAYEWHDGHTAHYQNLEKAEPFLHPHSSTAPIQNDQAAGKGVSTYKQYANQYGHIDEQAAKQGGTNLKHYDFNGLHDKVNAQVAKHGFQVYYAGGKYGKPDLANKNYNTGHLMVYNPEPDSGGDFGDAQYTDAWRKSHELAHALSYPELNQVYGEGRRIGKLGVHRTQHEAERAVHWEWLAAHKQRELLAELGHHIPDETFHKELNTVMHDAVHRAVTGKFTEPAQEGFVPSPNKVPLETSLGLVRNAAETMGLPDRNTLKPKLIKNEAQVGSRIWVNWLKVIEFLCPGEAINLSMAKLLLAVTDRDMAQAICQYTKLEPTQDNIAMITGIYQLITGKDLSLKKGEPGEVDTADPIEVPDAKVRPLTQDAVPVAKAILEAFRTGQVMPVKLDGKHSRGTLLATVDGKTILLKHGSGPLSPAAGVDQTLASQAARETAFYSVANQWAVPEWYPEAQWISINGEEYAAIEFLANDYKDLEEIKESNPDLAEQILDANLHQNLPHIWATLDYVLGNVDSHAGNVMAKTEGGQPMPEHSIKLIDHGSAFAGSRFAPGKDPSTFTPYYLRYKYRDNFNKLSPSDKLSHMVRSPDPEAIQYFIQTLDPEVLKTELPKYGIQPDFCLARLYRLQGLVSHAHADTVLNRIWVGLL